MITKVTFTGIDEKTDISRVVDISERYPFVEWGVLVSKSQTGESRRFPRLDFIYEFASNTMFKDNGLSLHLCGRYVRDLLKGNGSFITTDLKFIWDFFQRVQINTHGEKHEISGAMPYVLNVWPGKEYIFQNDQKNYEAFHTAESKGVNVSSLFDLSHGAGVLPEKWPKSPSNIKTGFAGGLGPENIVEQVDKINEAAEGADIWIDMETRVRSNDWLDLDKVVEVCYKLSEHLPNLAVA